MTTKKVQPTDNEKKHTAIHGIQVLNGLLTTPAFSATQKEVIKNKIIELLKQL